MSAQAPARSTWTWLVCAGLVAATFAAAVPGAVSAIGAQAFYADLQQPSWAPPQWLFGPVWTLLYLMMATAACLVVVRSGPGPARVALSLYAAQLVLNAGWTWLFFRWHSGAWATAEILALWLAIAATAVAFARVRRGCGALLLPYLAWVSFATALTLSLWQRNPGLL